MKPTDLRRILRNLGMTQEEFAKNSGVTQASISRWVNGRIKIHPIIGKHLHQVAQALQETRKDVAQA